MVFFFASAGVSGAYLTVSEIFPMETRALAIALFYAVGTGIGGIIGPQLSVGAILMIVGGLVEIVYGVKAERMRLEGIAKPLTAVSGAVRTGTTRAASSIRERRKPRTA